MIINGNCLEELKKLPDNSIDLILTDPPYLTTDLSYDMFAKKKIKFK